MEVLLPPERLADAYTKSGLLLIPRTAGAYTAKIYRARSLSSSFRSTYDMDVEAEEAALGGVRPSPAQLSVPQMGYGGCFTSGDRFSADTQQITSLLSPRSTSSVRLGGSALGMVGKLASS